MGRERDYIGPDRAVEEGRFYAPYDELEEYHAGMWRAVGGEAAQTEGMAAAVRLMRDAAAFEAALRRVMTEWPISTRVEFTRGGNQLAWFGQAACCLAAGVAEELTRRAWWKLTTLEQDNANAIARSVRGEWKDPAIWESRPAQLALFEAA